MNKISVFLKGLIIGGSMTVPGVSGGTMAMLLNIYDDLIYAVNSIVKRKWYKIPFLLLFAVSGGLGIILIANPLSWLIEQYQNPTLFFFMGAVIGGIPLMYRKAQVKRITPSVIISPVVGAAIVISMQVLNTVLDLDNSVGAGLAYGGGAKAFILLFLIGILIAAALVLPGISGSFMLLVLGLYEPALNAAKDPFNNLGFIIPIGIGALIGIFLTTGVLEKAMDSYPQTTYLVILGFVIGSIFEILFQIWPTKPTGGELVLSLGLMLMSTILLNRLSKLEE